MGTADRTALLHQRMRENRSPAARFSRGRLTRADGSLPGDQATIRGYSGVTLILEDEASLVSDELYQAIQPMLIVNKGQFIAMTTPFGKRGHFYSEWMTGGEDWKRIEVQAAQCPRITPDELEKQKRSMGEMFFRQEFIEEKNSTHERVKGHN